MPSQQFHHDPNDEELSHAEEYNLTQTRMTRKLTIQSVGCRLVHPLDHNISVQQANLGADGNAAPEPVRYGFSQVRALEV